MLELNGYSVSKLFYCSMFLCRSRLNQALIVTAHFSGVCGAVTFDLREVVPPLHAVIQAWMQKSPNILKCISNLTFHIYLPAIFTVLLSKIIEKKCKKCN